MARWIRKLAVVLATGYILFFFSERVFWSFFRPGDTFGDMLLTWAAYSLLAWVFLLLVRQCRVATFPALYLAGAIFGWLAEGVVTDTLYGNDTNPFPASISFTGLAWHALISVAVGWHWLGRALCDGRLTRVAALSSAVGVGWGLWAAWWPAELGQSKTSLLAFAAHTLAFSVPLAAAWLLLGRARSDWFRPSRFELPVLLGLVAMIFLAVRVPATPRSALILPPLLMACAYGLGRNSRQERGPDLLETLTGSIRPRSCLPLLLLPGVAILVYAPVALWGLTLPSNWVLYAVTMPLGFFFLFRSLWIVHRAGR